MLKGISDARTEVAKLYALAGVVTKEDQDKQIELDAKAAPTAWKDQYGAETNEELAYLLQLYKEDPSALDKFDVNGGGASAGGAMNPPTGDSTVTGASTGGAKTPRKTAKSKYTVPEYVSESRQKGILDRLQQTMDERKRVSMINHISMNLIPKPDSIDIYGPDAKGVIVKKSWDEFQKKLDLFKSSGGTKGYRLEPDDKAGETNAIQSTTNYNTLLKAYTDSKPVDVYMAKTVTTPKGYITTNVETKQDTTYTKEEMYNFIALEAFGLLSVAAQGDPTVTLRQVTSRRNASNGESGSTRIVLADVDAKKAYENGKFDVLQEIDTTQEMAEVTAKANLAIRVTDMDSQKNDKGEHRKRIIRVSVKTKAHPLKLKAIYEEKFSGIVGRGSKDFTKLPQGEDMKKLTEMQLRTIAAMQDRLGDVEGAIELSEVKDKLSAFGAAPAQAPAGMAM